MKTDCGCTSDEDGSVTCFRHTRPEHRTVEQWEMVLADDTATLRAELVRVGAERAALRRRVRLARATLLAGKSLAYRVLPLLDLRRPLPPRPKRHGGGR